MNYQRPDPELNRSKRSMKEDSELRTLNPELSKGTRSLDEILSQLALVWPQVEPSLPRKVLFYGEGAGGISSYVAGWMASRRIDVIVLDGANRFDPYVVSSFARRRMISPERLLRSIRIARAFTCHQMATLVEEKLVALLHRGEAIHPEALPTPFQQPLRKPCVILLGPITTFLDEDVPMREVEPLLERSLRKAEQMAERGVPFFLFQSPVFSGDRSPFFSFPARRQAGAKRKIGGSMDSRRTYLLRRLHQFSNLVWNVSLEDEGPKMVLKKGITTPPMLEESTKSPAYRQASTNHQTMIKIPMTEAPHTIQDE